MYGKRVYYIIPLKSVVVLCFGVDQMNFSYANELILREKNFEIAHGRPENTWYLFHNHVFGAAEVARAVADLAGMDPNLAYFSALLHDIGKIREKHEKRFHGVLGYEMLKEKNADVARACLVHTFPFNRLENFEHCRKMFFDRREDYELTAAFIRSHPLNDYDLLVQMADGLANAYGLVTIEERAAEYAKRHGIDVPPEMLESMHELKDYFDRKIGLDIYTLFDKVAAKDIFITVPAGGGVFSSAG